MTKVAADMAGYAYGGADMARSRPFRFRNWWS